MGEPPTRNVLFICTGNSARSIVAEALLNRLGAGRFRAWSAGSAPTGRVNPRALDVLVRKRIDAAGARSKSWDEFARPGAPEFDLVVTVCDRAAQESCPAWPGSPARLHWSIPDPAIVEGSEAAKMQAFERTFLALEERIRDLIANW
ncbi:MAG: arsenate reductase ArsC [Gammaproteobacteria bacterium]